MKTLTFILLYSAACIFNCMAQTDTVYTNTEKISCTVKEVTADAVKFVYPNEEIINTVYKNTIQKIVFKSGRMQTFAEATSYKTVNGANEFENVTFSYVQSEVNGLFKLGDVSAKAKGTTVYSSMEKVKERAYKKLKIEAAMMGANIIYIHQNSTEGNQYGGKYQSGKTTETNVAGVAYSNKLPDYETFNNLVRTKTDFQSIQTFKLSQRDADMKQWDETLPVKLMKVYNESGLIMVNAKISGVDEDTFRVIYFTNEEFMLMFKDGERVYNYKVRL
jgi:hypothetical protein